MTTIIFTEDQLSQFYRYEAVQMSGKFNMITESFEAAGRADLCLEDYGFVQDNYSDLRKQTTHT